MGFDFDFDCGRPMAFGDCLESAPDDDAIQDSIVLLWSIWCMHNEAVFRNDRGSIDNALSFFSSTLNLCRSIRHGFLSKGMAIDGQGMGTEGKSTGKDACFLYVNCKKWFQCRESTL